MTNSFYNSSKLELGKDYIIIKERTIKLSYEDITSISIINSRIDKFWLVYVVAGIIMTLFFLYLFYLVIHGFTYNSALYSASPRNKGRLFTLIFAFCLGVPLFILSKIKRYFKKHIMLIIKWKDGNFRIRLSEMKMKENDLRNFFELKSITLNQE